MIRFLSIVGALCLSATAYAQDHKHEPHDHADEQDAHADHNHHEDDHDAAGPELVDGAGGIAPLTETSEISAALKAGGEPIVVDVLGVVCDFCAKAMDKTFGKREEVAAVYVDLDTKALNLVLKPAMTLDDETIKKLVTKAGYKASAIRRGRAALKGIADAADPS